MTPLWIALLGIVVVVAAIAWARLHAFFALVLAALVVALLGVATGVIGTSYAAAVETVMTEVGATAGRIVWVIVAAAVIGGCLTASGAAERIVESLLGVFGEKRAGVALLLGGFILAIPVFFDTVFILLLPLAHALARKTGGNYVFYVLAICAGGVITHSNVPPTPGPLVLAEMLHLDLSAAIVGGLVVGLPVALFGLGLSKVIAQRTPVALPAVTGRVVTSAGQPARPSLGWSLLPVVTPLIMIAGVTFATTAGWVSPQAKPLVDLVGNKNIALLVALVLALLLVVRQGTGRWGEVRELMTSALEISGPIVLITSAGGAFGAMIQRAGVGKSVELLTAGTGLDPVLLAWFVAAVVRVAQGSATVAMLTSGGIITSLAASAGGPHPVYLYLAIGYGAFFCSWMNDSGFWLVSRLGGLTERQTLRTWTVMVSGLSLAGLALTWLGSRLLPLG